MEGKAKEEEINARIKVQEEEKRRLIAKIEELEKERNEKVQKEMNDKLKKMESEIMELKSGRVARRNHPLKKCFKCWKIGRIEKYYFDNK